MTYRGTFQIFPEHVEIFDAWSTAFAQLQVKGPLRVTARIEYMMGNVFAILSMHTQCSDAARAGVTKDTTVYMHRQLPFRKPMDADEPVALFRAFVHELYKHEADEWLFDGGTVPFYPHK